MYPCIRYFTSSLETEFQPSRLILTAVKPLMHNVPKWSDTL